MFYFLTINRVFNIIGCAFVNEVFIARCGIRGGILGFCGFVRVMMFLGGVIANRRILVRFE
jgi:hypothetical protein